MADNKPEVLARLDNTQIIDGLKWIAGRGNMPSDLMIVGEKPDEDDVQNSKVFTGDASNAFMAMGHKAGIDFFNAYLTNAVKYNPPGKRAINAGDLKACRCVLRDEMERCKPKLIACLGANAIKAVMGKGAKLGDYRSTMIPHPDLPDVKVLATYGPGYILRNPEMEYLFKQDLKMIADAQFGRDAVVDISDYMVITTAAQLREFKAGLFARYATPFLFLDCEWHGKNWMDPKRYIRTVQLGIDIGMSVVIEFTGVNGVPVMDNPVEACAELKSILEDPRVGIGGHNVIADGEWLLSYGIDIRERVRYDTMLAEHAFNETGPFGLEVLTCKYTNMGRYDVAVSEFKHTHVKECKDGYGPIPREILIPYGAKDVDGPRRIMIKQLPELEPMMVPRGEYPSLWDTDLYTQKVLYEIEMTGMLIDKERLSVLSKAYYSKFVDLQSKLKIMAQQLGMDDFNYNATAQVRALLFDKLKLTPIKTTKNKRWSNTFTTMTPETQKIQLPSTDKNTLEILQDKHPIVRMLLNTRRVGTMVKYFLKEDDTAEGEEIDEEDSGVASKIWPDGRIHPRFSQLSETARFKTSKPNCQNWPKKAEGFMADIFGGKDKVPPLIRTAIVPSAGHVLMESDYIQAELFVLAALSGDKVMWDALTTPGRDMHDYTAIKSFKLTVLGPDGQPVEDGFLLSMAKQDIKAFEVFQKQLTYVYENGKRLTRSEFKDTIRVSAKNLNFGIPYGRGSLDIARQIKGDTGDTRSIEEITGEVDIMMYAWKEEAYIDAWKYMCSCAEAVESQHYIVNPWGRYRHFPQVHRSRNDILAGMQREAQNFPIQSTVADTCMLALYLMCEYRKRNNLHFKIVNQIHDAIMLEVPVNEVDVTKTAIRATMGNIKIPLVGREPLILGTDITVMTRWGEKVK